MKLLWMLLIGLFSTALAGQTDSGRAWVGVAMRTSVVGEKMREGYTYTPTAVAIRYGRFLSKNDRRLRPLAYLQIQGVRVAPAQPLVGTEFEFGLHLGLAAELRLITRTWLRGAISSGPHYFSTTTSMQARGFIFSDNFTASIRHQFGGRSGISVAADVQFRHISNAGLQSPNIGVDNWLVGLTVTRALPF